MLVSFSVTTGVMPDDVAETLLLVIALSMLITPLLFILYDVISKRMEEANGPIDPDEIDEEGPVIIAGDRSVWADREPSGAGSRLSDRRSGP